MLHTLPRDAAPGRPLASVAIPGSKSATNRALFLAALAPGRSHLTGALEAEDTRWMRQALVACGLSVEDRDGRLEVMGGLAPSPSSPLWLGASGTTLRFLLPWLALRATGSVTLEGEPRLFERPLEPLLAPLRTLGARFDLQPGRLELQPAPTPVDPVALDVDAALSSQFLSGLAMTLAGLPAGGRLRWTTTSSLPYLALTDGWLARFGVAAERTDRTWSLLGGRLRAAEVRIPADWSGAAAFFAAAAVTGRPITLGPWDPADAQGDQAILSILEAAGARVAERKEGAEAWATLAGPLYRGLHADLEGCPDLGPVLAAVAALAPGPSTLTGLHTLPLKECDRLDASAELVRWLGGTARVEGDHTLHVQPGTPPADRPPFDPRNDHRMAFAAAVGGLRWGGAVKDPHCVAKTFPTFWEAWEACLR